MPPLNMWFIAVSLTNQIADIFCIDGKEFLKQSEIHFAKVKSTLPQSVGSAPAFVNEQYFDSAFAIDFGFDSDYEG